MKTVFAQGIYVPDMMLELTNPRVLIMEWIEGRRLRRAGKNGQGPSRAELQEDLKLVEIGVQCSLEQVCRALVFLGRSPQNSCSSDILLHCTA